MTQKHNVNRKQNYAWSAIQQGLSNVRPDLIRDVDKIQKKWKNLFSLAKKCAADMPTGGAPPDNHPDLYAPNC